MKIALHKIGNKIHSEGCSFSDTELEINDQTKELLKNYFLGSFKSEETFHFYHESALEFNIVYKSICNIFLNPEDFINQSKNIGRHLYDAAENPRIQGGELFVVYFQAEDESEFDKIGIFKTEKKEDFFKIFTDTDHFDIEQDRGFSFNKIDKAALIYNNEKSQGYILSVVDNNKNGDMYYWFEDFLKVKQREDEFFQTQENLSIYKSFITKQLPVEFEITKADQAEFLNKGLKFFKEKDQFDFTEFTNEVLEDGGVIESFGNFKSDYELEMQISVSDDFAINTAAVKKHNRGFKTVISLDKNFSIYIHGDRKLIDQGSDENGKYYKLYFEEEK